MKPGFMSSVCPDQTLPQLIETAKKHGYKGIEFRTEWDHQHGIELTATSAQLKQARATLADAGIAASCIATGVKFNSEDPADHLPHREDLRRYIALAAQVGAPYLRTFSDTLPEQEDAREKVLSLAADSYASLDDWAQQHGVEMLVETHTNMSGQWARQILDQAQAPSLQVLWHIGHHLSRGQSVDETYPHIRGHVRHLHFGQGRELSLDQENLRSFELLSADGFTGFFSVEYINPENPEQVLAINIAKFNEFIQAIS